MPSLRPSRLWPSVTPSLRPSVTPSSRPSVTAKFGGLRSPSSPLRHPSSLQFGDLSFKCGQCHFQLHSLLFHADALTSRQVLMCASRFAISESGHLFTTITLKNLKTAATKSRLSSPSPSSSAQQPSDTPRRRLLPRTRNGHQRACGPWIVAGVFLGVVGADQGVAERDVARREIVRLVAPVGEAPLRGSVPGAAGSARVDYDRETRTAWSLRGARVGIVCS